MAMDPLSIGNESPPARQSILGSLLRGRPRGTSQSHPSPPQDITTRDSPPPPIFPPPTSIAQDQAQGHRRRPAAAIAPNIQVSQSVNNAATGGGAFSQMLRRRRSAGALASSTTPQVPAIAVARTAIGTTTSNNNSSTAPSHRIRLVPHLDSRRSLRFDPIARDVREGDTPLRIGRFTDRSGMGLAAANALGSNKLAFKSKVVSRAHAEIWCESGARFFIKDTKSSSGTFLNHVRLSPANTESRPHELRDGDLLQLGVDYQGGTEDIYKCVKIKIEVGREWQTHSNPFNANALKQLKAIAIPLAPTASAKKTVSSKSALPDCCICLFAVTINQALFIAPCSHAFHYKCIRPLLDSHHPAFSCPLCRTYANLEEDVEVEVEADSVADVSAVVAAVSTDHRPSSAGDGSRERIDRIDAGAETEVEPDAGGARLRSRQRPAPPLPTSRGEVFDLTEDVDQEMEDLAVQPHPDHGRGRHDELEDDDSAEDMGQANNSAHSHMQANRSNEYLSEDDAEEGGSDGSGRASGEGIVNGKRKR
ncbi:hypothetical protein C8Q75DRAFT_530910 [Abortiporus biennis]|nr:hypothetical protein C8Q75DRAFT_530910 [Abortiporus biennis]